MKWPTPPTVGDRVRRAAPEGELGRMTVQVAPGRNDFGAGGW